MFERLERRSVQVPSFGEGRGWEDANLDPGGLNPPRRTVRHQCDEALPAPL